MWDKLKKWMGIPSKEGGRSRDASSIDAGSIKEGAPQWQDAVVSVGDFKRIEADGALWVQWSKGSPSLVVMIDGADYASGRLSTGVVDGVLHVGLGSEAKYSARLLCSSERLESFTCKGVSGGAALDLDEDVFEASVENGARLVLSGTAVAAKLSVLGVGALQADGLGAHAVYGKVSGAGILEAKAEAIAEVSIGGGGEAIVYGNPSVAKIERVGPGRAQIGHKVGAVEIENADGIFGQLPLPRK